MGNARQVAVDDRLALRIKGACCLVENENARIQDQGAGNREPLALAARYVARPLIDERVVATR